MPSIATGANAANRDMYFVGVSGDGDTASIGMGAIPITLPFIHNRATSGVCYA